MEKNNLPLRIGVGAIVLNNKNKIFVGKRKDNPVDKWQMPQGGVNKNENFLTAMKRELEEETSIIRKLHCSFFNKKFFFFIILFNRYYSWPQECY